jgi:ribosomal protein S18 acetylase RimI-like enzyme
MEKRHFKILTLILSRYPYNFYMFGSRVKLTARKLSDIDLFYKDEIPDQILGNIEEDLEESNLPYKVDIVDYNKCDEEFKKILNEQHIILLNSSNKPNYPIYFTSISSSSDIDFLTQKINQETQEFGEAHSFAFFIRDENDEIIAGCNGSVIFGAIYTDQLWVHPDHRKVGLGNKLMEMVHDYGRKSGCTMATISTMSFQGAKALYEKLGYISDFERQGYAQNSSSLFMIKNL